MKKRRLSILLSLVMLLSLLPTTALAATYPDTVRVYNASGAITSLDDGQCLVTNDASATSYTSGAYVARYEKSTGTLYLKDYHGVATDGRILADGDLNIKVEGDSSFTTSLSSATNYLYGIQANGTLTISGSGTLTVSATGKGNVYGIYAKEGVTISAPLAVTVGKNNTEETGPVYGIYTESAAISLSGADKTITATGGKDPAYGVYNEAQTSSAGSRNITISGKLTVNLSNGSINRGISSQGGDITLDGAIVKILGSYHYGIFNLNGNVVIKSTTDVELTPTTSSGEGICTYDGGDLTIENSTVKVSAEGYAANLKGNVSIKDSMVDLTRTSNYYEVIKTGNSSATNTIDLSTSGSVTLTASGEQEYAMITGKVTLGTNTKCEKGKADGNSYDGEYDTVSGKTVLQFMHESTTPTATVDAVTIGGTTGTTIANKDVVITLTNDTFASTLSGDWITNLPAGLSQSVSKTDDTHAKITVSGNPSETSSAPLIITIPKANLASNADLTVTNNPNAVFAITAPATTITDTLVPVSDLTGKKYNESAQEPTFSSSLTRGTDYTVSYAVKSSFTGTLNSDGKPVGAGTYLVTVTGKGSYTGSFDKDFKIDKADPVYTAPTSKPGLTYTGAEIDLINAGSVTKGGGMQYKLDSGSYSTTIPTATNAGDYIVYYQITTNDNYNAVAGAQVGTGAINIAQVEWGTPTETLTPVNPTTAGGGSDGKITGTTSAMQYKKSTDSTWTDCTGDVTGLDAGNYYVRYIADGNHTASDTHHKTVTLTDPGATLYGVTVTDGTAAPTGDQAAGTEVTITANAKTGFNFKEWIGLADSDYMSGSTKTSNPATFIMPTSNVSVKATYEAAALTGTASITGTLKYGAELTASLVGGNNTGTLTYKWYRSGKTDAIATNNTGTYTLTADDIGKTITVKITSSVQTGEITSSATGTIEKADGPAAPSVTPVACTNSSNNDGKITGVNTTMEYSAASDFSTKTACTSTVITDLTNGTYYVRVAETTTHKAGTAATVIVLAYTASGTGGTSSGGFSGGGYVPTTQKPDIKAGEGGSIVLSKDGTTATITPNAGMMIDKVMLNGKDMGALTVVKGIKTGDKLDVSFKQTAEEKAKMDKAVAEQVAKAGLTARSARTAKKNVKLVVQSDLEGITDAGYTVAYKFYRSTKKSAGYKAMKTGKSGIYINTYGKKGTLYYYKVKVMVYDKDGNLTAQSALKQCKYASRLWTK